MIFTDGIHVISSNSLDELHDFALNKLKFKPEWFQNHPRHPHYDTIYPSKKKLALKHGAKLVRKEEISIRIKAFVNWPAESRDIVDCVCKNCGPYPHYYFLEDRYDCVNCGEHIDVHNVEFKDFVYQKSGNL